VDTASRLGDEAENCAEKGYIEDAKIKFQEAQV